MSEQRPTFIARKNPGTGWEIDILWPDGETEVIKGVMTEYDTAKWIAEHGGRKYKRQVISNSLGAVTSSLNPVLMAQLAATNNDWERAIETMLSLANEAN
jgi:hypothetical protein